MILYCKKKIAKLFTKKNKLNFDDFLKKIIEKSVRAPPTLLFVIFQAFLILDQHAELYAMYIYLFKGSFF